MAKPKQENDPITRRFVVAVPVTITTRAGHHERIAREQLTRLWLACTGSHFEHGYFDIKVDMSKEPVVLAEES